MFYNQQTAETNQVCLNPGTEYCLEWQINEVKTFNYFDTLLFFLAIGSIAFFIKIFSK